MRAWDPKPDVPFHLEVADSDPTPPHPVVTPSERGGFGLRIVADLADAWGIDHDDDGNTVWAEFNRPAADDSEERPE